MNKEVLDTVQNDFEPEARTAVIKQLESIELKHVMAQSEYNLLTTRMSILYLAKGNLEELIELTNRAKIDFRDVIMWATQEKKVRNR